MEYFQIETAQNVSIQQNVASISLRIGAYLIDFLILGAYIVSVMFLLTAINYTNPFENYVAFTLVYLPVFFYSLLFETLMNGQTPGKRINNIRVTKIDGSKPTFSNFLFRWALRIIDISISSGSIAVFTILLNGKGQRLGDLAAGTTVINERSPVTIKHTIAEDLPIDYKPSFPQVTTLSDKDIQTIKDIYTKSKRQGQHGTIVKLHAKIIDLTGISTDMKPIDFVAVVIKDYNYFTQQM